MATKTKNTKTVRVAPDPLPIDANQPLPIDDKHPLPLYKEIEVPADDD